MRRYWVPKEAVHNDQVVLNGEVLHHIRDVCRLRLSARFEVLVDGGEAYFVEIIHEDKHSSTARIISKRFLPPRPRPDLILVLSLPRLPVFESVVEKCVELGVHRIEPVTSDFSFFKNAESVSSARWERWQRIVTSSTQQSGRGDHMQIMPIVPLSERLQKFHSEGQRGIFAYEGQADVSIQDAIASSLQLQTDGSETANELFLFIGSEGGFSTQEVEMFHRSGLPSVGLGSQVLRVETACIALISILKFKLNHFNSNN